MLVQARADSDLDQAAVPGRGVVKGDEVLDRIWGEIPMSLRGQWGGWGHEEASQGVLTKGALTAG